jgi:AcrR family transcriptional regulator
MPRYKEADREEARSETRRRLLDAATEAFARDGYAKANINRISQSAGYAKGTIYNYFESKRMLMMALIDDIAESHVQFISEKVQGGSDPDQRLAEFFRAGFDWVMNNVNQGLLMINTLYSPDEEFKRYMFYAYEPMFQLVAQDILAPGIKKGRFRQVNIREMTHLLMTLYLGTASQVDAEGRVFHDPGLVADFALHALQRGAAPPQTED